MEWLRLAGLWVWIYWRRWSSLQGSGRFKKGVADRVDFRVGDAQDLPSDDDRFDLLICESVNTSVPDLDQAAVEYVRVIRKGGLRKNLSLFR